MEEVLKELMGESYKEGLTKEEISSFFENSVAKSGKYVPLDKYTNLEKKAKTVDDLQKELDTYKNAQLTEQQKLENALEASQESNRLLKQELCKSRVSKVLSDGGLTEEDYNGYIDTLVLDDVDKSVELAQNLVNSFNKKIEEEVKNKIAEKLADDGKKPRGAEGGTITQEQFDKMSYSQQVKLAQTNPELYKSLSGS